MKRSRRRRILVSILAAVSILMLVSGISVQADGAKIMSAQTSDESLYLYVQGVSSDAAVTVQIGSTIADEESIAVSGLRDLDVPMRTLVLLDNSLSIPSSDRSEILEIVDALIEDKLDNELIRIGTYSDEVTWLCDFTADRSALSAAADGITFENQASYLSDILYDILLELAGEGSGIYTRILIITDGADDKSIGYTNEEVRTLIGSNAFPIYTVGVQITDNSAELETLFSFSRASSAEYYLLHETASEQIISGLLADQENLCIAVALEESLLDGGSRSVRVQIETAEGSTELTTSVTMPFASASAAAEAAAWDDLTETAVSGAADTQDEQAGSEEAQEDHPEEDTEDTAAEGTDDPEVTSEETKEDAADDPAVTETSETEEAAEAAEADSDAVDAYSSSDLGTAAAVFALVVIIGIVLFFFVRWVSGGGRRNTRSAQDASPAQGQRDSGDDFRDARGEETLYSGQDEDDEATLMMGGDESAGRNTDGYYLILTNLDLPKVRYRAPLQGVVSIGRHGTDIVIRDDPEVSRTHCRIELREGALYLEDAGSMNGTMYENRRIPQGQPTLIAAGGRVKIGRYTYSADLMQQR